VRRGASIGANATIVCGVTLGEYAFIGAGAVVTKDVFSYALMAGVPGPPHRVDVPVRGTPPRFGVGRCAACGTEYVRDGDGIRPV
jgi:UDP-2-acetamido-3-amino-2,3-dideoxy-glucuronate N-acetyltransferase